MNRQKLILPLTLILSALSFNVFSQTTEYSLRSSVKLEMKIAKNLKLELTPEFRYSPGLQTGSLLVEAGMNYKVASWLNTGGYYRLNGSNVQGSEAVGGSSVNYSNRFAVDVNTKINIKRFTPKFRVRFSNFTDFDSQTDDRTNYLRYRFGLDYNIKGIKITPYAAAEFYQKLSSGLFSKSRYTIGGEYEFNKHHAISAAYSFANTYKTSDNEHIFELTYKIKF